MYDLIIVGAGPAGLTACLYALRFRLKTLLVDKMQAGGYLNYIDKLDNYPGFPEGIGGAELTEKITLQLKNYDFQFQQSQVSKIINLGKENWQVQTAKQSQSAKTLIIACGRRPRKIGVPGEQELTGKGVSYCAVCDAPFFKGKDVIVIGGGNTALEEALYLSRIARKVTLVHRRDKFRGDALLQERVADTRNISFLMNSVCEEISGGKKVEAVNIKDKQGNITKISAEGVFIFAGMIPETFFLKGIVNMDEQGYVIANENLETSAQGIFACGDCRANCLAQVVSACGEGAKAANSAHKILQRYE